MSIDSFSIDTYCIYLNALPAEETGNDSESRRTLDRRASHSIPVFQSSHSPGYVFPRLIWMAIGPGLLMLILVLRLEARNGSLVQINWSFGGVVAAILAVRWITWLAGDRRDSFGRKTGIKGLFGFTGLALLFAGLIWTLANLIAVPI